MTDATGARQAPESSVAAESRTAGPSKARRRFILAAGAALPSIYTLSSGAQIAVASNTVCTLKQQGMVPARFTTTPTADNWLRAPVNVGEYDGTPADCVTSPQSACMDPASNWRGSNSLSPGPPAATNAQRGSIWIVQGNRVVSSPFVPITNVDPSRKHYGLVYVDQAGTVSTLDPNGSLQLIPVTTSCWASVIVGRTSKLG
jgi:hypothetical protein